MKRQILFVQGGGEGAHDEWDNKLVDSLRRNLGPDYEVRYPRMPNEADPIYAQWKAALADEIAALDDGAILVGHSLGGTILINALADEPPERKTRRRFSHRRALSRRWRLAERRYQGQNRSRGGTAFTDADLSLSRQPRTRPRRLHMSIFIRKRSRARRCAGCVAATTSSTTTWLRSLKTSAP